MADDGQLKLLQRGVEVWNLWRKENYKIKVNLSGVIFKGTNLSKVNFRDAKLSGAKFWGAKLTNADLSKADLIGANLSKADLTNSNLRRADLSGSNLSEANLTNADLWGVKLSKADLSGADLTRARLSASDLSEAILYATDFSGAHLRGANLSNANLSKAELWKANLEGAILVGTNISQATISNCFIYGLSVWDLEGAPERQENLVITRRGEAAITVDDLEVAQFIYLLLKNEKIKNIIDTITSKAVLILGRFTEERRVVLEAIRKELRKHNFTPILLDLDKPASKDVTGTVETLARMARFIIADLTDPSSIPHELATIVPFLRTTPVLPIRLQGEIKYGLFERLVPLKITPERFTFIL